MTLDENGFLDTQIDQVIAEMHTAHQTIFDACLAVNRIAQKLKYDFAGPSTNLQAIMSSCLFIRVLNGFQAAVICSQYGLSVEARVIARTMLEAFFFLKKTCEDESFADGFLEDSEARQLGHINYILNERKDLLTLKLKTSLETEKADLEARGIDKVKKLNIPHIVGDMYSAYRSLSDEVHPTAWSVQRYLRSNADPTHAILEWGPSADELEATLILGCEIVVNSLRLMSTLFDSNASDDLNELAKLLIPLQAGLDRYYRI